MRDVYTATPGVEVTLSAVRYQMLMSLLPRKPDWSE